MKELEKHLKAVANKRRLAILKHLKRKPKTPVLEIARVIAISFRTTSKHLAILAALDIVEREQKGLQMLYSLSTIQRSEIKYIISML